MMIPPALALWAANELAVEYGLDGIEGLRGRRRDRQAAGARKGVARVLREADWTLLEIGGLVRRHHTTVMNQLERASQMAWEGDAVEAEADYRRWVGVGLAQMQPEDTAHWRRRWPALRQEAPEPAPEREYPTRLGVASGPLWRAGYVTTATAARRLGVQLVTIRYWISAGRLPAEKRDGRLWIPEAAVMERVA